MQIEIKIDKNYKEPKIIIITENITEEINNIVKKISQEEVQMLVGFSEDEVKILEQEDIIRIYASSGKVYAITNKEEYSLRLRLYELENRLDKKIFVRISNSEIINLRKVKSFDLSFIGTICVRLSDETTAYVSRRYVSKIKKVLGI